MYINNVKIESISQVHIGNGNFLQYGNDFIVEGKDEDAIIHVLSLNKLKKILNDDHAIINQWTEAILNNNSGLFLQKILKCIPPKDYSLRNIDSFVNFQYANSTLKECMHDGMGRPYIPGSSIKGAIRTVLMAVFAKDLLNIKDTINTKEQSIIIRNIEKKIFGNKPENDIMRFMHTGDAYFEKGIEIAVKQVNINITQRKNLLDERKAQAVEVIPNGETSSFRLKIESPFFKSFNIKNHEELFSIINQHTKKITEEELHFWASMTEFYGHNNYVNSIRFILDKINKCDKNECVLRLGQASGWRYVTGSWLESLDSNFFKRNIVPLCRPKNKEKYSNYPFPKSRRIDDESYLFGFVKLTLDN